MVAMTICTFWLLAPLAFSGVLAQEHHKPADVWVHRDTIADGVDLRILPLGDSITRGEGSTDGNGYRQELLNKLSPGNKVEYIGSVQSGNMENNHNEGHRGFPVGAVAGMGKPQYVHRPNVVLVMAGTNNFVLDKNPGTANIEINHLIGTITKDCPDALVLVATIPPIPRDTAMQEQAVTYNRLLSDIVSDHVSKGKHVALVDMSGIKTIHIHKDGIHPMDTGYVIMALGWYKAIAEAGDKGWIKPPVHVDPSLVPTLNATAHDASNQTEHAPLVPGPEIGGQAQKETITAPHPQVTKVSPKATDAPDAAPLNEALKTIVAPHLPSDDTPKTIVAPHPPDNHPSNEHGNAHGGNQVPDKQVQDAQEDVPTHPLNGDSKPPPDGKPQGEDSTGPNHPSLQDAYEKPAWQPPAPTLKTPGTDMMYYLVAGLFVVVVAFALRRCIFSSVGRYRPIPQ